MENEELLMKAINDYQDVTAGGIENLVTRMNKIDGDLDEVVKKVNRPAAADGEKREGLPTSSASTRPYLINTLEPD